MSRSLIPTNYPTQIPQPGARARLPGATQGLISLPTHLPVGKVLFWSDVKAWLERLGMICFQMKHPTYSATENEAAEMLEGECRTGFLQAHSQIGCATWVFWCGCTVYVEYTVKAKTIFPEVFNGICRCPDARTVYGEIPLSPCSVLIPCL